jgi:hypothetical protein
MQTVELPSLVEGTITERTYVHVRNTHDVAEVTASVTSHLS